MNTITLLGEDSNSTFSAYAYRILAEKFGAPGIDSPTTRLNLQSENEAIIGSIATSEGYGAMAFETISDGRIDEAINPMVTLLDKYGARDSRPVPVDIAGGTRMKLKFALMTRPGVSIREVKAIVSHQKSFRPCKDRIRLLGVPFIQAPNNGAAIRSVALGEEDPIYRYAAALGPGFAASSHGLIIIDPEFQDGPAETSFALFRPKQYGKRENGTLLEGDHKIIMVFRLANHPLALVPVLQSLAKDAGCGINLNYIHSVHVGSGEYDFIVSGDCGGLLRGDVQEFIRRAKRKTSRFIFFGPFPMISSSC